MAVGKPKGGHGEREPKIHFHHLENFGFLQQKVYVSLDEEICDLFIGCIYRGLFRKTHIREVQEKHKMQLTI